MSSQFPILVVDDDLTLIDILSRAAQTNFAEASFTQVYSVDQAMSYIQNLDGRGPRLILLDINFQGKVSGLDFLTFLRAHPIGRFVPVVVFTVSELTSNIRAAYKLGASSFTLKPFSFEEWGMYFSTLRLYWLDTVTLPAVRFEKNRS